MDQQPQESASGPEPSALDQQPLAAVPDSEPSAVVVQPPEEPNARPPRRRRLVLILSALAIVLVVGVSQGLYLVITHQQHAHALTTGARPTPTATIPLAQRWRVVDSLPAGQDSAELSGVAASSPSDAWAWGRAILSDHQVAITVKPVVLHWDGQSWKPMAVPSGQHTLDLEIGGMAALAPDNAWLIGYALEGSRMNNTAFSLTDISCVMLHWDGHHWRQVSPPPIQARSCVLRGITALSATDIWAVGGSGPDSIVPDQTLVLHWNGQQWSVVPAPSPGASRQLTQITALSATDIWAIGSLLPPSQRGSDPPTFTLIEHWDGRQWSVVPSPNPGTEDNTLFGITALAPNDVWVVGHDTSMDEVRPLTLHWDGRDFRVVASPTLPVHPQSSGLHAVAALGPDDIWAVGSLADISAADLPATQMLLEHWDGQQWSIVAVPTPGQGSALYGLAQVPHTNQMWAVGIWSQSTDPTAPTATLTLLMD